MATRHREPFSAPVQLESLLEVPCKLILIEDLIREKSALTSTESTTSLAECSTTNNKKDDEESSHGEGDRGGLSRKKCLFDCCATPSRWRDTECYSNSSQFRTAGITLPWQESLAVIPVMQVKKRKAADVEVDTGEDTDIENTKISDEERGNEEDVPSDVAPLPLTSPSESQQVDNSNNTTNSTDKDVSLPKSIHDPNTGQESASPTELQSAEDLSVSSSPPTVVGALVAPTVAPATPSPVLLGKVTEKPTRYEDFIIAQCSNTINSNNNSGSNTITSRKDQDVIGDTDTASQGSNNSADDTLKLTFYNEGRKESTKEFRTAGVETGGTSSSSSNDIRYFENQGLQMSRVIRELGSGSSIGSEGNARLRQHQQPVGAESMEINRASGSGCNDDNTQNYSKNLNLNDNVNSSSSSASLSATASSSVITQSQQLRLSSSIIQNLTCNNDAQSSNSSSINEQVKQWEGLQISRCQKDLNNVITLEGEDINCSLSNNNREINSESSLATTTIRPMESGKGESENSIERHLQSYLTSLRYVKPAESGNERISSQELEAGSKGRSPVISPQSRHAATNIISPVISPLTSSLGAVRMPSIQRVSPSQQAASMESWPERTIARIPTRPYTRRNTNFEQHQEQQLMQPRTQYHGNLNVQQQQSKMIPSVLPGMGGAASIIAPVHSPPKRLKTANVPTTSPMLPHTHSLQQQQHYQQGHSSTPNRYLNINNSATMAYQANRSSEHHSHNMPQQAHSDNSGRIPSVHQHQTNQAYNNVQAYNTNQRPTSVHRPATGSIMPITNQTSHHSQSVAQSYLQQQSQDQHQYPNMKYPSNSQSQQQQQQQQLQFRHIQESLLIASAGGMGSSSENVDKAYSERLRRYCEYYHRQELDVTKLHEYYKKYGFYPWDILTARDESIIRQRRNQEQQQQHQQQAHTTAQHAETRDTHNANVTRYDNSARQMDMDSGAAVSQYHQQQLQQQRQFPARSVNLVTSPTARVTPNFSPSQPTAVAGSTPQAGIISGRVINASPSVASAQVSTPAQNRYNNNSQQLQQFQQLHQRDYTAQQQRTSRYHQQADQHDQQNYHRNDLQQQQQTRTVERCGNVPPPTNYDVQSSPHYRSAYNQLAAAAAAAVSSVAGTPAAAVVQNQLRTQSDVRIPNKAHSARDERMNFLHPQSGVGIKPIVMTVSDPVPAPPEAIPLSIHRQALEQAIKNNQVTANNASMYHPNANNRDYFRRDQGRSPHTSPILPQHVNNQLPTQHGQSYATMGRASRNDDSITGGVFPIASNKEPLRVAPSPTLPHQTSVIRRIQQQDNPSTAVAPFVAGTSRYVSDRPGISYRRVSEGNSADSNSGTVGVHVPSTAFLYQQQQHKDSRNIRSSTPRQSHYHNLTSTTAVAATSALSVCRNILPNESLQGNSRGPQKRRIIITDNNGINQNIAERCPGVVSSPVPLIAGEEEVVNANVSPSAIRSALSEELPDDDDRMDSIGGGGWQYDHVVLLDKRIKTYMCKRCFETLKTEQQIRNHLFCKMLANHVQCHVCLQLVTSDTYPAHLQIHGVRPPDNIQMDN